MVVVRAVALKAVSVCLLFLFLAPLVMVLPVAAVNPDWANADYSYRKYFTVGAVSGAGTNYQVKLTLNNSAGSDSGSTVYLADKVQDDFDDIRFYANDNATAYDFWVETYTSNVSAVVWVEVQANLTAAAATVWLYYGDADATSASNVTNTFIFGDDFRKDSSVNASKWTACGTPTISFDVNTGLTISSASGVKMLRSVATLDFSGGLRIITNFYGNDVSYDGGIVVCPTSTSSDPYSEANWIRLNYYSYFYEMQIMKKLSGSISELVVVDSLGVSVFQYNVLSLKVAGASSFEKWTMNGTSEYDGTSELHSAGTNYIYIYCSSNTGTVTIVMKYLVVAKYVASEPALSGWSSAEQYDNTKPTYTTIGSNSTACDSAILLYVYCNDNIALSKWCVESNETGSFVNSSFSAFAGTPGWANATVTSMDEDGVLSWRIFFNDTQNNWNVTVYQNITIDCDEEPPIYENFYLTFITSWYGYVYFEEANVTVYNDSNPISEGGYVVNGSVLQVAEYGSVKLNFTGVGTTLLGWEILGTNYTNNPITLIILSNATIKVYAKVQDVVYGAGDTEFVFYAASILILLCLSVLGFKMKGDYKYLFVLFPVMGMLLGITNYTFISQENVVVGATIQAVQTTYSIPYMFQWIIVMVFAFFSVMLGIRAGKGGSAMKRWRR